MGGAGLASVSDFEFGGMLVMGESGFVEVKGGQMYDERDGDGPAVVLVSGGFQDVRMSAPQIESLSSRYSLVRCDLLGFGRSSQPPDAAYRHCDELRLLLDAAVDGFLEIDPVFGAPVFRLHVTGEVR